MAVRLAPLPGREHGLAGVVYENKNALREHAKLSRRRLAAVKQKGRAQSKKVRPAFGTAGEPLVPRSRHRFSSAPSDASLTHAQAPLERGTLGLLERTAGATPKLVWACVPAPRPQEEHAPPRCNAQRLLTGKPGTRLRSRLRLRSAAAQQDSKRYRALRPIAHVWGIDVQGFVLLFSERARGHTRRCAPTGVRKGPRPKIFIAYQ